jgi:hypothetical protein
LRVGRCASVAGGAVTNAAQTVMGTVDTADNGTTVTILDGSTVVGTTTVANGAWSDNITLTGTGINVLTATDTNTGGTGTSTPVDYTLAPPPPPPPPPPPSTASPVITSDAVHGTYITLAGTAASDSLVTAPGHPSKKPNGTQK